MLHARDADLVSVEGSLVALECCLDAKHRLLQPL